MEDAVRVCARILPVFEAACIPVIRLGLNPTEDLSGGDAVGGAYHPALGELVKVISKSKRNIFPVVDPDTRVLLGVLLLDEVRNIMFRPELYDRFTVGQLMISPPATINQHLPMEKVMQVFEDTGAWNLPVVDDEKRYVGYVSKSKIFNSYRHVLVHFSEE